MQSNDDALRFDGQVIAITGAGNGLGRSHALLLASRGARVVVNDPARDAAGSSAAEQVVAEIRAAGGVACASLDSVLEGERIVEAALDAFGRIDGVINNAGFIRDRAFHNLSDAEWQAVVDVHLQGAYRVTHAAWPHLRQQNYGRVLFTVSAAGIYGNFGQANYGSAKLALYGLARTLAVEGARHNIRVNAVAPIAASQMMGARMPESWQARMTPEAVSPVVAWLCHADCPETGGLFEAGGGWFAKLRWERSAGATIGDHAPLTPEAVARQWAVATSFAAADHPADVTEAGTIMFQRLGLVPG
ncbi:serine/threonine protein kinase [Denitratisoma sp. DHT3]|nr:serine/threonine protein kinase [Denitratisoma sp. DHT3]